MLPDPAPMLGKGLISTLHLKTRRAKSDSSARFFPGRCFQSLPVFLTRVSDQNHSTSMQTIFPSFLPSFLRQMALDVPGYFVSLGSQGALPIQAEDWL